MRLSLAKSGNRLVILLVLLAASAAVWFVESHPRPWAGLATVPTMQVGALLKVVDPAVVLHRVEVPQDRNAWPGIMAARRLIPRGHGGRAAEYTIDSAQIEDGAGVSTSAEAQKRKRAWYPVLARLDRALRLPDCQVPPVQERDDDAPRYLNDLKSAAKALVGRAVDELAAGRSDLAAKDLVLCHRLGVAMCRCQGPAEEHYVQGVSVSVLADHCVQRTAADPHWRPADLRTILAGWGSPPRTGEALATSLQVEFTRIFLPKLAAIRSFRDWWTSVVDPTDTVGCALLEQAMSEVFAGHSLPFDRVATAREGSAVFAVCIRNLSRPWKEQVSAEGYLRPWGLGWPRSLNDIVGPGAAQLRKDLRLCLHKVDNALGKRFVIDWGGVFDGMTLMFFRDRTHWQATRIVAASMLYTTEHAGRLPAALSDLASGRYLGEIPTDPYSGRPFRYDPKRKIVWSVGLNGVDDGGDGPVGGSPNGLDMVYSVDPPLHRPKQKRIIRSFPVRPGFGPGPTQGPPKAVPKR